MDNFFSFCVSYHSEVDDFCLFWINHSSRWKHLAILARKVAAVPMSSAGGERMFSIANYIIAPRRNRMKPDTLEALMMGKVNILLKYNDEEISDEE